MTLTEQLLREIRSRLDAMSHATVYSTAIGTKVKFLVDTEDLERIEQHKWRVMMGKTKIYFATDIDGKLVKLHRFLMGPAIDEQVDHINRNNYDNRKGNLRICSAAENSRNRKTKPSESGLPRYIVHNRTGFRVQIRAMAGRINERKTFPTLSEAVKYRDEFITKNSEIFALPDGLQKSDEQTKSDLAKLIEIVEVLRDGLIKFENYKTIHIKARSYDEPGNSPGHAHTIPGVWDRDNGSLAGKRCAQCYAWNELEDVLLKADAIAAGKGVSE